MSHFNLPHFPQIKELGEFIDSNSQIMQDLIKKRSDITKKWLPVIERGFTDIKISDDILSDICIYLEICALYYENLRNVGFKVSGSELSDILIQIKEKILSKETPRSGVLRKVYNYKTGFMEYELEDGNFVKIINESVSGPRLQVPKDIFCDQFVKHIDINSYRDIKIDQLL